MTKDKEKICEYCKKEFIITEQSQKNALAKGGNVERKYCNSCLLRWRKDQINLTKNN